MLGRSESVGRSPGDSSIRCCSVEARTSAIGNCISGDCTDFVKFGSISTMHSAKGKAPTSEELVVIPPDMKAVTVVVVVYVVVVALRTFLSFRFQPHLWGRSATYYYPFLAPRC